MLSFFNKLKNTKLSFSLNIKNRLLVYFIVLALVPTSIVSILTYNKSKNVITQKVNSSINKNLQLTEDSILQKFNTINDMCTFLYMNPDFIKILSTDRSDLFFNNTKMNYTNNGVGFTNEISSLDKILESFNSSNTAGTVLYPKLYMFNRPEYIQSKFSDRITELGAIENEAWYKNLPYKFDYIISGPNTVSTSAGTIKTIRMAKRLFALKHYQVPYAGLLTIDTPLEDFSRILKGYKPSAKSMVYVIDRENHIVLTPDMAGIGETLPFENLKKMLELHRISGGGSFEESINSISMLVSYREIKSLRWTILSISPLEELYSELTAYNKVTLLILFLSLLLAFTGALYLSNNISYPIRKLVQSMSKVSGGNLDVKLNYRRNDEFQYLIQTYNKMMLEIRELIDKLYASEAKKKEAELKSLQAQINPHFLYNTLDSINWMAIEHDAPEISKMVTSLSDFFRYSLNKGKNIISLEDEIKQVESYLLLQKMRFGDILDYRIDFPAELSKYITIKLILQPFVENAIVHGIKNTLQAGFIALSTRKNNSDIEIRISNSGANTDIEYLNSLVESDGGGSKSYGIQNVNQRIKQTFGTAYGIKFAQNLPDGVTVTVTIPALTTMEGYHAENDHCR